jgi:RNA polymerase sigma factor (TIGR02999 family)
LLSSGKRGDWHSEREIKPVKSSDRDSEAFEQEATVADKGEVTRWLIVGSEGDARAFESLLPLVYEELHRQAVRIFRRERAGHTLQPTALVNEVYLRLINQQEVSWQNRAQFFGIAAQMMRRILVDHARQHQAAKRGGSKQQRLSITSAERVVKQPEIDLLALNEALDELTIMDPQQAQIVELKFFGGLSIEETAEVLGISPATVKREWVTAKAWLYRDISRAVASNES